MFSQKYHPIQDDASEKDVERVTTFDVEKEAETKSTPAKPLLAYVGLVMFVCLSVLVVIGTMFKGNSDPLMSSGGSSGASFDILGRYIMKNFDEAKPMSSFLAGLGGLWGVPMWAFYINRGQGITSFGIQNKDGGIAKFLTAEKAYQETAFTGFRTFLKGERSGVKWTHMPFFPNFSSKDKKPTRNMMIGMNEMEIEEVEETLGLKTNILYYTVPGEDFPSLVRSTTFTNLADSPLTLDVLDGLGRLVPSGLSNGNLDTMGRTMEAWMNVYNVGKGGSTEGGITMPFYHISQGTGDTAQVQMIKDGHFVVAFIDGEGEKVNNENLHDLIPFIVDPNVVFDTDTTLVDPRGFFDSHLSAEELAKGPQGTTSRTPCAFASVKVTIPPLTSITVKSIYGHADSLETFVGKYGPKIRLAGYTAQKRKEAAEVVATITSKVETTTASPIFDAYIKQDFLDNVLRGGLPVILGSADKPKVYHTYSRIHGDIERDYNFYQIDTTYFSQGPGNFRDVNQNRRVDVFHTPAVGDFNARMFLSLVQADGYNPLTVATTNFKIPSDKLSTLIASLGITDETHTKAMAVILAKPFRVGQLFKDMKTGGIEFSMDREEFLTKVMDAAEQVTAAQFAQNGFWADHWTYTLDLVENYVSIFPDKEEAFLWESEPIPFFMSPAIVKSRADRYLLVENPASPGTKSIRVYNAIAAWGDPAFPAERMNQMNEIFKSPTYVADPAGAGGIWQTSKSGKAFTTSAIGKLLILGVLKFSTLDPMGMGVEMEGGKPGWNDAMNGLPGIVGSGMPETYEMTRILKYVKAALVSYDRSVSLPIEFTELLTSLAAALDTYKSSSKDDAAEFSYWDASNSARETYRKKLTTNFDGSTEDLSASYLTQLIGSMEDKIALGVEKALATSKTGLSPSYFHYECSDYKATTLTAGTVELPKVITTVEAKAFKTHTLPLFLEGPTRHLKIVSDIDEKREIYNKVRASALYDSALKMYTLSESLVGMGQDIGRMMAFSAGWLENQSVWLHMSYKFYLELLRGGLYEEFFAEIATGLVPNMDSNVYGRSPLEAASFIVSSAFPDPKLHGASFLPRLSGSTAEFMSMWTIMMAGNSPFHLDSEGKLVLELKPVLTGDMFTTDGKVVFTFLGGVKVTYYNPKRANTWETTPKIAILTDKNGNSVTTSPIIESSLAEKVRSQDIISIDMYY